MKQTNLDKFKDMARRYSASNAKMNETRDRDEDGFKKAKAEYYSIQQEYISFANTELTSYEKKEFFLMGYKNYYTILKKEEKGEVLSDQEIETYEQGRGAMFLAENALSPNEAANCRQEIGKITGMGFGPCMPY